MSLTMLLYRLGRFAARRRWWVMGAWVLATGIVFATGRTVGPSFVDNFRIPGSEAQQALDVLKAEMPQAAGATATVVFHAESGTLTEPARMADIRHALAAIAKQPNVIAVDDPTEPGGIAGISVDGTIGFATVRYDRTLAQLGRPAADLLEEAVAPSRSAALEIELGGPLIEYTHLPETSRSEVVGVTAAVVVLFIAFGSLVAMGLPVVTALLGLGASLATVWLLSRVGDVPTLTPALSTMLGLGVGIDYALFIVTRFREGLSHGMRTEEAVARAIATSGQAVLFAGGTVMVAIYGLWVSGVPFIGLIGTVSSIAVAIAVLVALTLMPAMLSIVGRRIDSLGVRRMRRRSDSGYRGAWTRWAGVVAKHPWRSLVAGLVVVGMLVAPLFSIELGYGAGVAGKDSTQARAAALIARGFGPGMQGPLLLVVELPRAGDKSALTSMAQALGSDRDIAAVASPTVSRNGTIGLITAIPRSGPTTQATADLVTRLRDTTIPPVERQTGTEVLVGGATAMLIDVRDRVVGRFPLLIVAVVALSFLLLMLVFRSVLVPLKAAIVNGLSICAALGAVVAVFQWGWGVGLTGLDGKAEIISFVPTIMFAILFGLSMDYEVFLLSRVREEYLVERDTVESVTAGVRTTAQVITSAALVMIAVFLSFLLNESTTVKMIGFGLAVAVLIDATIVRVVLVPSAMVLLGHANWWLPKWLDRILPHFDIEGETGLPPVGSEPAAVDLPDAAP